MQIVQLRKDQFREAKRLDEYAFQDQLSQEQREKQIEKMKTYYRVFGIYEKEELAAKAELISFAIHLGDKKVKMGGIAGVATYPEFRRKGYVKELFQHVLRQMRDQGYLASILHPFDVFFYRKFGWELLCNQLRTKMKKTDLVRGGEVGGKVKRFDKQSHPDDLEYIYDQFAQQHYGMLVRSRDIWMDFVYGEHPFTAAVYYNQANQASGYILYKIHNHKMVVKEFVPLDQEARNGLWHFICQHDSMIEDLEMTTTENEPLFFTLPEPRVKAELAPYGMVRIVDVVPFLQQYPFQWRENHEEVIIHISDRFAPWNQQTILCKDQQIQALCEDEAKTYENRGIRCDINSLSAALFGYRRPQALYHINQMQGDAEDIEAFDKLIPAQQPFFYNFF